MRRPTTQSATPLKFHVNSLPSRALLRPAEQFDEKLLVSAMLALSVFAGAIADAQIKDEPAMEDARAASDATAAMNPPERIEQVEGHHADACASFRS